MLFTILLDIPSPMSWTTNQVANIINIFSAIGTVGSLIFLIVQERRNSKRIDNLALLAQETKKQTALLMEQVATGKKELRMKSAPAFSKPRIGFNGEDRLVNIILQNDGHKAYITKVTSKIPGIKLHHSALPCEVEAGSRFLITVQNENTKKYASTPFSISMEFVDINNNEYISEISGNGLNPSLSTYYKD